jgi:two-component system phosphate regulon response regulator PhoB
MANEHILVVEDEEDIQELLKFNLEKEGYVVSGVTTGEAGIEKARAVIPDLVLLDLMLPGLNGLDVCRVLKGSAETKIIPVVMVTAKGEESDVVTGLELGADDYMVKPFSPKVLLARIRAVLRRGAVDVDDEGPVIRGDLRIDPVRYHVSWKGKALDLTATEFNVLLFLSRKPGWVFTRKQIVDSVKGEDYAVTERAVDVQMVGLRKKLGEAADLIETVRGIGYKFKE